MSSPGDVLGVESCIDLRANHDDHYFAATSTTARSRCGGGHRSFTPAKAMKKAKYRYGEYPPPLPSLGMEMRRYRTGDGRLIIREEKTSRPLHDVFRADRSNGRLTLHFLRCCPDLQDRNDGVLDVDDGGDDDGDGVFQFQMDDDNDDEVEAVAAANSSTPMKHGGAVDRQKRVTA